MWQRVLLEAASQSGTDENCGGDPDGQPDRSTGEHRGVVVHLRAENSADEDASDQHHHDDCLDEQIGPDLLADRAQTRALGTGTPGTSARVRKMLPPLAGSSVLSAVTM